MRYRLMLYVSAAILATTAVRTDAAANKEHQQLMADIRILQEQSQQLQQMLGSLSEAMKAMSAKLDEQTAATRRAFADQKLLVDNATSDLRVVREKLDETNVRITSLSQEVEALRLSMPRGPSMTGGLDQPAPSGDGGPPPDTASAPSTPPPQMNPGVSPQRLYDSAWADYAAGQWSLAIEGFKTFIRSFPKSELADDAQYLIGDSLLLEGKFAEALDAYEQVIKNYPTGDKLSDAYYKRGVSLDRLGQADRARQSYEYVVKNYPETAAGRLAKQRLSRPGSDRD